MVRFAGRRVGCGSRIGSRISCAWERGGDSALHIERKILCMSQRAAHSLRGNRESARGRTCGRAKNNGRVGAGSDAEGTRRIGGDAGGQAGKGDLNVSGEAIQRVNGYGETLAGAALRNRDRAPGQAEGKIRDRRRGLSEGRTAAAAGTRRGKKEEKQVEEAMRQPSHETTPQRFRAGRRGNREKIFRFDAALSPEENP